jgi:hypothetical protein
MHAFTFNFHTLSHCQLSPPVNVRSSKFCSYRHIFPNGTNNPDPMPLLWLLLFRVLHGAQRPNGTNNPMPIFIFCCSPGHIQFQNPLPIQIVTIDGTHFLVVLGNAGRGTCKVKFTFVILSYLLLFAEVFPGNVVP